MNMQHGRLLVFSVVVALVLGCDGRPQTSDAGPPAPHEGKLVLLPGGKGYVEVVKKPAAPRGTSMSAEASFYFLDEYSRPRSDAPQSGTLVLGKKSVALKSTGEGLATPDGPALFARGDVDGILNIELDGKPMSIPLGVRE